MLLSHLSVDTVVDDIQYSAFDLLSRRYDALVDNIFLPTCRHGTYLLPCCSYIATHPTSAYL
jgi:hypothetical protein